jgi:4'-phosphopantetheinyl transferase
MTTGNAEPVQSAVPVAVWLIDLDTGPPTASCLSADERVRAARFVHGRDARRWTAARAALRLLLAAETGRPPDALAFGAGPSGKPVLRGDGPAFNLSHSGRYAAVALAAIELGVDLEAPDRLGEIAGPASLVLSPAEARAFDALAPDARGPAFLRLWTRKEAALKLLGTGLRHDPRTLCVGLAERPPDVVEIAGRPVRLQDLSLPIPGPAWPAALATHARARVTVRAFDGATS